MLGYNADFDTTIVISGYYGFNNIGDEAILMAILQEFRRELPKAQFYVLTGDPLATELMHHGVRGIDRLDLEQVMESIAEADLVIQGGGGLYHDYYEFSPTDLLHNPPRSIGLYGSVPLMAAMLSKPCMMYAQGIGPLFTDEAKRFVNLVCQAFDIITVRDEESHNLLKEIGVRTHISVTADPAFRLVPSSRERVREILEENQCLAEVSENSILGVCVRPWRWTANPEMWEAAVATALDMFLENYRSVSVLFVPFQLNHPAGEDDLNIANRIRSRMRHPDRTFTIERLYRPDEILGVIRECSMILGMRLHALIFAAIAGKPIVSLAYDPKVSRLMRRLGCQDLNIELANCTAEVLFCMLERGWCNKNEIEKRVRINAQKLAKLAGHNTDVALQLLERSHLGFVTGSIGTSKSDLQAIKATNGLTRKRVLSPLLDQLANYVTKLEEQKFILVRQEAQIAGLQHVIAPLVEELQSLRQNLNHIHSSKWWKLASLYWALQQPDIWISRLGQRFRSLAKIRFRKEENKWFHNRVATGKQPLANSSVHNTLQEVTGFLRRSVNENTAHLFLIFSGTRFTEDEGQRPTRIARELARRGIPVIFAYWRWSSDEPIEQSMAFPMVYPIPIDQLVQQPSSLLTLWLPPKLHKVFLIEFPHPYLFELVNLANAYGWYTVYDVLDDWEEFYHVGQAVWYDQEIEEYIIRNVDLVTVVSKPLEHKLRQRGATVLMQLPNALEPACWLDVTTERNKPVQGEPVIGYFGHLTNAWFDWELVIRLAVSNPTWTFELIGYGEPEGLSLPQNITLVGKVPHKELPRFASRWNVAIIPFKLSELAKAVDPIKVYEYLYLQLPVVVTGIPHLADLPYVWVANDDKSFEQSIIEAANTQPSPDIIAAFISKNTWSTRVDTLLNWVENHQNHSSVRYVFQVNQLDTKSTGSKK